MPPSHLESRLARSSKLQVPSSKKAPNPKHQDQRLNQFKMSKLKIKNARMLPASGNLLILNFAFLILLTRALELGTWSLELCPSAIPPKTSRKLRSVSQQ